MIFVDTSFWIAVTAARDARHDDAVQLLRRHGAEPLVTSTQIRGETWTFIRRRYGHPTALAFLDSLQRTRRVGLVFVTEEIEEQALGWLRRHDERGYSFVDATSFALMRSLRVTRALAFDEDFAAAGFEQLRA